MLEPPADTSWAGVLETDLPLSAVAGLRTAIDAGTLELFDPAPGYTGMRLRRPTGDQRERWNGRRGPIAVLEEVEARAKAACPQNR